MKHTETADKLNENKLLTGSIHKTKVFGYSLLTSYSISIFLRTNQYT